MKYYDGGVVFFLIALFIGSFVGMVAIATNEGETPVHSTYVGVNGDLGSMY